MFCLLPWTENPSQIGNFSLTLLHSELPKLNGVLAVLSAVGLRKEMACLKPNNSFYN